jgi:lipid II:glycine glycyltransferase (peptidoglycan interpeptide bridge formation enzyme)
MVKLTKEQQDMYDKIKDAKCLMSGLFDVLEKSFDSIFEIEWSLLKLELKEEEKVKDSKENKKRLVRKKKENEIVRVIPDSDE